MTLGGMALAVGILVDDATVAIENINRNLEAGKELEQAILDGSAEIATPALVSTLAICIVFIPMFFLSGVARVPLRSHGGGGDLRHAGQLPAFAYSRAHHGALPAEGARRRRDQAKAFEPQSVGASFNSGSRGALSEFRIGYLRFLTLFVDHPAPFLLVFLVGGGRRRWEFWRRFSERISSPR